MPLRSDSLHRHQREVLPGLFDSVDEPECGSASTQVRPNCEVTGLQFNGETNAGLARNSPDHGIPDLVNLGVLAPQLVYALLEEGLFETAEDAGWTSERTALARANA